MNCHTINHRGAQNFINFAAGQLLEKHSKHAMHAAPRLYVPAPSFDLLRFLRSQAEDLWFFSPNSKTVHPRPLFRRPFRRNTVNSFPHSARAFGTTKPCRATLEASLWNFDFLRHPSRHEDAVARTSTGFPPPNRSLARHASTEDISLIDRLWEKRRKASTALKDEQTTPLPSLLEDPNATTYGRSKAGKAANELRLRCTEINEHGDVTLVNGEFKKSELIAKVRRKHLSSSCDLVLTGTAVWLASTGSAQDRLVSASSHTCPALSDSHQPPTPQGPDQERSSPHARRIRLYEFLRAICLHVRLAGQVSSEAVIPARNEFALRIPCPRSCPHQRYFGPGNRIRRGIGTCGTSVAGIGRRH